MKARKFNSVMPKINYAWAARVLGMTLNPNEGPDLLDDNKVVELKFTLVDPKGRYSQAWTVLEYQMEYGNGNSAFWGLGQYWLKYPVSSINTKNPDELEKIVTKRELHLVEWNWMQQFPPHYTEGSTRISVWQNTLRYPKLKLVPKTIRSFEVEKGLVHLTEGINLENFPILS